MKIKPGDRITYKRTDGSYKTRTVHRVGDNYVTVMLAGGEVKVPVHQITSHVKSEPGKTSGNLNPAWYGYGRGA